MSSASVLSARTARRLRSSSIRSLMQTFTHSVLLLESAMIQKKVAPTGAGAKTRGAAAPGVMEKGDLRALEEVISSNPHGIAALPAGRPNVPPRAYRMFLATCGGHEP